MLVEGIVPPVVVVLRAPTPNRLLPIANALVEGGVQAIEFTLTTPGALRVLHEARSVLPDGVQLGCGTVRTRQHVDDAVAAGADFLVSQIFDENVAMHAAALGVEFIPGALTPTEIVRSADSGFPLIKVSPVGPAGGVAYIRELAGPLPDIALFPTGGVRPEDAGEYIRAGATLVGLSGLLLEDAFDPRGDLVALTARTSAALAALAPPANERTTS